MTRQQLIERILWAVDGYRFDYLTRVEMLGRITKLIDENLDVGAVGK